MIKRILSVFCLLCSVSYAGAEVKYMTVVKQSAEKFSFLLKNNPVVTFDKGIFIVNTDSTSSFAIDNVAFYLFTESDETAVDNLSADELRIIPIDDATVEIQNAPDNANVTIISAKGMVLGSSVTDANGNVTLSLPNQKGVYVLTVGNKSIKVIRK